MHFTLNYSLSATSSCRSTPPPTYSIIWCIPGPQSFPQESLEVLKFCLIPLEPLMHILRVPLTAGPYWIVPHRFLIFRDPFASHVLAWCAGGRGGTSLPGRPRSPPDGEEACRQVHINYSGRLDGVQSLEKLDAILNRKENQTIIIIIDWFF